jgi:uncharacterized protein YjdB
MKTLKQRTSSPWAFAAIAAMVIFGLVFTGCGSDDDGGSSTVAVTGVTLVPTQLSLTMGETESAILTVTVLPAGATNKNVTWATSDSSKATVNNGTVTAVAKGSATITVTTKDGNKTATCVVTVFDEAPPGFVGIRLNEESKEMLVGTTFDLVPTATGLQNPTITWESSDPTKATVSSSGRVTAQAAGTTRITAKTQTTPAYSATCDITVKAVPVTDVTLSASALSLNVNMEKTLSATVAPNNASQKVSWTSSDTSKVSVTVNQTTGVATVKGLADTTTTPVTITATSVDKKADGTYASATCTVTVPIRVATLELDKYAIQMGVTDTETLAATVTPNDAFNKTVNWSVTGGSDKVSIAVNQTTGVVTVTANAIGEAVITATTTDGSSITKTCEVEVLSHVPVTGITLSATTLRLTEIGEEAELTATVAPRLASDKSVTWESDDETEEVITLEVDPVTGVATITATGLGSAIITVTSDDDDTIEATCAVTVSEGMPEVDGMVWIKPGTYQMGSPTDEEDRGDDETQHWVTISQGFYMTESPVMAGDYSYITDDLPTWFYDLYEDWGQYWVFFPMDGVNWYAAVEYCNLLSDYDNLTPVYNITVTRRDGYGYTIAATVTIDWTADGYRLPTEAEWEYACRAGTTTAFSTGEDISSFTIDWDEMDISELGDANFVNEDGYSQGPLPVFFYDPNPWGLYGMHGTLEEWCWDWYATNYGGQSGTQLNPQVDPKGPSNSSGYKVVRGGSWTDTKEYVRSAARWAYPPEDEMEGWYGSDVVGFRVVRNVTSSSSPKATRNFKQLRGKVDKQLLLKKANDLRQGKIAPQVKKPAKGKIAPQSIRVLDMNSVSPVKPQALRRKAFLE